MSDRAGLDETEFIDALLALIDFDAASGVDCALDESPHDRFAEEAARREADAAERQAAIARRAAAADARLDSARPSPAPAPRPAAPGALGTDEAVASARARAAAAADLDALRAALEEFDGCALKFSAKSLVFADGAAGARVMLVGEAPGAEEDRSGVPFVGRAGRLLDKMLGAIGLSRADVYIANVVPWRPPGNRTPTPQEVAACLPFTRRQIELVDPDVLVCLGAPSAQTLLGVAEGILKARGRWRDYETGTRTIRALPMLHPAYLLRNPAHKRLAWRDLRALRAALDGSGGA